MTEPVLTVRGVRKTFEAELAPEGHEGVGVP